MRWTNCDPTASYTIPRGTIVRTTGGIAFAIDEAVFLPVAILSGTRPNLSLKCQSSEVAVTAVKAGTEGNVGRARDPRRAGALQPQRDHGHQPRRHDRAAREEFPRVSQKDVDAALATLERTSRPSSRPSSRTRTSSPRVPRCFPETAVPR